MLFSKKKPKLDSKVRFQHKQFTTKLDSARGYKRTTRAVPESRAEKALSTIGITSRWSQVLTGILLLGLLYLIYIPNFLTLKQISIAGLSENQSKQFEQAIRAEIKESPFYYPQYNLLFLETTLIQRAASKVPSIDSVTEVRKNLFSQTIFITAPSKYERFLVANPEKVYDVYNDGTLKQESGVSRSDWDQHINSSMFKVRLYQPFDFQVNQSLFREDLFSYIKSLADNLSVVENQKLAYFSFREPVSQNPIEPAVEEVPQPDTNTEPEVTTPEPIQSEPPVEVIPVAKIELPFSSSEVHAVFYKNNDMRRTYTVLFDATADARKSLEELKLLLSQTAPDRYDQLNYVDLRIPNKAFICLESAPCAK